jgi:predicted DNA-binding transcriptional regulator YafY
LAKICNVGRRTIFRDLAALRVSGLPLEYDSKTDRYSASRWLLPPTQLTAEELRALSGLAIEFGLKNKLPFHDSAFNAVQKVERTLPKALRKSVARIVRFIDIQSADLNPLAGKVKYFQQLIEATVQRRVLRLRYGSLTECETIETKLRPYHLLFSQHSWYVLGRSLMHGEVRTFNLDRIESLETLNDKFAVPRTFNLEKHLGNAWRLIPSPGPDSHVLLRFSSFVAQNVHEVKWHKTQRTKFLADGSLQFEATISGLTEICWWILRYGDQVEVLKPVRLRRMIAERVKKMSAMYQETS